MISIKDILNFELLPAMGCTEPGSIAYACSIISDKFDNENIKEVYVEIDKNLYKNGMSVGIPNAQEYKGNLIAAALGLTGGDYTYGLQSLKNISNEQYKQALQLIQDNKIFLKPNLKVSGIHIYIKTVTDKNVYEVLIQKSHTNIIYFKHNNKKIDINTLRKEFDKEFDDLNYIKNFKNFKLNDIIKMIDNMDTEDIKKLEHSIELNLNIAEYGISKLVNYTNKKIFPDCYKCETKNFDKIFEISRKVFAAIYTRMSGEKIPVMSSGGSGNAGITITLPLVIYAENNNIPENKKIKSLALAHIINSWIRCYIGRIGGLCGGVIAAGAGVSAGITYQMEGSVEQIKKSILNCLNSTAGIICDGAKNSCAFKISNFVYTFFQSAFFAKNGIGVNLNEGIIGEDLIETFRNMELLSNNINNDIDHTIINIINKRNHNFKIH